MQKRKTLLLSSVIGLWGIPAYAELNLWQQNFVGCSTSASPYISDVLFKDTAATRPLMKISGMQAWSVPDGKGGQQLAMTTDEGLTIYGRVVGPQGEDISGALLATSPTVAPTAPAQLKTDLQIAPPQNQTASSTLVPNRSTPRAPTTQQVLDPPQPAAPTQSPTPPSNMAPPVPAATVGAAPPVPVAPAVPTAPVQPSAAPVAPGAGNSSSASPAPGAQAGIGSQTVLNVPKASNLDELIQQADRFAMWAPMNNPKPDAPVVYMFVDPTCPHCAWSLDHLEPKIRDGSIALRMIMAPILSEEALHIGISIIQNDNPPEALLQQAKLAIGSKGRAVNRLDPTQYDQRVKDGIARNVQWMRANGIPGVPFYLYRTAQKTEFAFGSLSDAQLATALPDGGSAAQKHADAGGPQGNGGAGLPSPASAPQSGVTGAVR
jgi:hypothetical protein